MKSNSRSRVSGKQTAPQKKRRSVRHQRIPRSDHEDHPSQLCLCFTFYLPATVLLYSTMTSWILCHQHQHHQHMNATTSTHR